jgi:WD40 repeat protein
LPRLFISHSSKDNVYALAFQNWLTANGWSREDVFIDLHGIGAGERWRDTLRKANHQCEAVVLLASPDSLDSKECQREMNLAEDQGKEIIVALLRDLTKEDPRLSRYSERQFVDLSLEPKDRLEPFEFDGRMHRVEFNTDALAAIKMRLGDLGIAPGSFGWPPKGAANPKPFPGLSAFTEDDAGIFFGRDADIMGALTEIRMVRRRRQPRLIVIDAASGAGKSSFLRAGLWPRLNRDPDFAPLAILRPAQGILTGPDGLGRKVAPYFERYNKIKAPGAIHSAVATANAAAGIKALAALLSEATELAATVRKTASPDARAPAPLLAIDQGEELFSSENDAESRHFLALLASVLKEPPETVDPYVLITIRADSVQSLLNRVAELGLETPKALYLPPLSPAAYRDVILKPVEVYSERVRRLAIEPALANALVLDAVGADALPLLAFTLAQLFADFSSEGTLTLARYREIGGANGSIGRALRDALARAGLAGTLDNLRRLIVPRLATWDPDADQGKGAAKRLVASYDSITSGDRAPLAPLVNSLVTARLLMQSRDALEVAHEALLRQAPIGDWLEENREFLVWRDRISRERTSYEANERGLLVGRELQIARDWIRTIPEDDIAATDQKFVLDSASEEDRRRTEEESKERQRQASELQVAQERAAASRRLARRTMVGLVTAVVLAVLAVGAGAYAFLQQWEADRQRAVAEASAIRADIQRQRAEAAETDALRQRDVALQSNSRFLTGIAQDQLQRENTVSAMLIALEAIPDPKTEANTSYADEARLLVKTNANALFRGMGIIGPWHVSEDSAFDVSTDGRRIVVLANDQAILIDVQTSREVARLPNSYNHIVEAAFLNSSRTLLTVTDDLVEEWDADNGKHLRVLCAHGTSLRAVAFSPERKRLMTVGKDGTAQIWDTSTGNRTSPAIIFDSILDYKSEDHRLDKNELQHRFVVTDDGRRALTINSKGKAVLWDAQAGRPISTLENNTRYSDAALSPDNQTIAIGNSKYRISIWSAETGALVQTTVSAHGNDITALAFNPSGNKLISGSWDKTARIWRVTDGSLIATLAPHKYRPTRVGFNAKGDVAYTQSYSSITLWDLNQNEPVPVPFSGSSLRFINNDRLLGLETDGLSLDIVPDLLKSASTPGRRNPAYIIGHKGLNKLIRLDADAGRALYSNDDSLIVVDIDSTKERPLFAGHLESIRTAFVAGDDAILVISSKGGVRQFSLPTGAPLSLQPAAYGDADILKLSPDKRHFSMKIADSKIKLLRIDDKTWQTAREFPDTLLSLIARSPEGAKVLVWSSIFEKANILDLGTVDPPIELTGLRTRSAHATFSPDGSLLAFTSDGNAMTITNSRNGAVVATAYGHVGSIGSIAFSPDGHRIITASQDGTARVWEATSGKEKIVLNAADRVPVTIASFSPDGRLILTQTEEGKNLIWDADTGRKIATNAMERVIMASFSPDGLRIVGATKDKNAVVWETATGRVLATLTGHTDWVRCAAFSPDGRRIVTGSDDATIRLWDAQSGVETAILRGHSGHVTETIFSPDGTRIFSRAKDGRRLWDARTGESLFKFADASVLADRELTSFIDLGFDYSIAISPIGGEALTARLRGHEHVVHEVNFSSDGFRIVTASQDGARVWDVLSGRLLATLSPEKGSIEKALFIDGNARIVTSSDDYIVRVWNVSDGQQVAALKPFSKTISSVRPSPDGRLILVASYDNTARIWNLASGNVLELQGHTNDVNFASFSPDGNRVVTASDDRSVRIWDSATGVEKLRLRSGRFVPYKVYWHPNGRRVFAEARNEILLFDVADSDKPFLPRDAAINLPRCLTPEQRLRFYLPPEPPSWCVEMGKWPYETPEWKRSLVTGTR